MAVVSIILLLAASLSAQTVARPPARLAAAAPESVGMSASRLAQIDAAVLKAIEAHQTPGAVVLVARKGRVVYRKAFGDRAVQPAREAMTPDTVFDLASLTKILATATSILILVERGQLSLADPVTLYIPEFGRFGKERVTVEQLLTHRAGFVPDNELADYVGKSVKPLERIYDLRPAYDPGTRFVYSDVGYIVAAEIVRRVSGKTLDQFAEENIFAPLGMKQTFFSNKVSEGIHGDLPAEKLRALTRIVENIAPTEMREGRWMRGEVHDPRAYELGGVAGHAGLFSTADDVAVYCQMILNKGEYAGARILAPYTVERMVSAHSLPTSQMRGIGWDVNTTFSSNRGDLFPVGTFGHTGFTGTSIWIDPQSETFVVVMTNRVHPTGRGDITRLRSFIASIVAGSITAPPYAPVFDYLAAPPAFIESPRATVTRSVPSGTLHPVLNGIDVLARDGFKQLEGRRVALITNHTGRDRAGRSTIDVLAGAKNFKLVSLIAPEHGLRGTEDDLINETGRDEKTGLPVHSIYAKNIRRPTPEMLADIDTLVFDIQDVGTRFYTYI
ncbi:MAG TPA: serine hydrolase, partial [Blastocatellia bacterium]|nr:serine hydrolase [Blastocatellia bacterium]